MTKLSDTQRVILSAAAQHEMGLARAPKTLPAAARNAVFRSLIKNNLLTEINAPREHVGLGWRQDDDGTWIVARITDDGLRAIGIDPNERDVVVGEPDCSGIVGSVPDTAPTVAPDDAAGESPAPANEAAHAAPLTEEIALLDQLLAAPAATPRATLRDAAAAMRGRCAAGPDMAYDMLSRLPDVRLPRKPRGGAAHPGGRAGRARAGPTVRRIRGDASAHVHLPRSRAARGRARPDRRGRLNGVGALALPRAQATRATSAAR